MKDIPHLKKLVMQKSTSIDHKVKICLENQKEVLGNFIDAIKEKNVNHNTLKRQINRLDQAAIRIERIMEFYEK